MSSYVNVGKSKICPVVNLNWGLMDSSAKRGKFLCRAKKVYFLGLINKSAIWDGTPPSAHQT